MVEATPPGLKRDCNVFEAAAFKRILRQERLPTYMRAQASMRLARLHPLRAKQQQTKLLGWNTRKEIAVFRCE
jgi:hypothetical protein